jgi:sugar/nucleoside kinase (ribokinase family)
MFFDLADPEKRPASDIVEALELIGKFEQYFDVILGLNEKESFEIGEVLGLNMHDHSPEGLCKLADAIRIKIKINTVVVHPVAFALASSAGDTQVVQGPFCAKPLISTGAGDHFNSGFCLGKLLGFDNANSLLAGVSTSGFYVRTGQSPTVADLAGLLRNWPSA